MSVTTATLWVCSRCGFVSHVDGGNQRQVNDLCQVAVGRLTAPDTTTDIGAEYQPHSLKPVLVVVPYA